MRRKYNALLHILATLKYETYVVKLEFNVLLSCVTSGEVNEG